LDALTVSNPIGVAEPKHSARDAAPRGAGFDALLSAQRGDAAPVERVQVRPLRTPLSAEQAAEALSSAWRKQFGEVPSKATVAILTAQWAHETGRGDSMFNYNFGGIKGAGPSGLTVAQRTFEGWGETRKTIVDNFRAYSSAEEGAKDYLSLLARRYEGAIDGARAGDPAAFVRELKSGGYFTGNEQLYTRSITSLARQSMQGDIGLLGSGGPLPDRELLTAGAPALNSRPHAVPSARDLDLGRFLDEFQTQAVADEMSRSALRLAATSAQRRDRNEP
jgi:hypothetical protein